MGAVIELEGVVLVTCDVVSRIGTWWVVVIGGVVVSCKQGGALMCTKGGFKVVGAMEV